MLRTDDGRWYYYNRATNTTQWHPPHTQQYPGHPGYPPASASHPTAPHAYPTAPHAYPTAPHAYPTAPHAYPGGSHSSAPSGHPSGSSGGAGPAAGGHRPAHGSAGGASSRYTYNTPTEFKLKEKAFSLSGDGFSVKNTATGAKAFKVKGNAFSLKDSKKIVDGSSGKAIYSMVENILTLRGRMSITDSNTKASVVTLRKKGFIQFFGASTVQVWRGSTDDGEPWLQCKGDFFKKNFDFKELATGRVVASVRRKSFNLSNILLEKDTYVIRVEPGVDCALLVFLVVALDEQFRDDGNRKGMESRLSGLGGLGNFL